jgi:hypothetical protein
MKQQINFKDKNTFAGEMIVEVGMELTIYWSSCKADPKLLAGFCDMSNDSVSLTN